MPILGEMDEDVVENTDTNGLCHIGVDADTNSDGHIHVADTSGDIGNLIGIVGRGVARVGLTRETK